MSISSIKQGIEDDNSVFVGNALPADVNEAQLRADVQKVLDSVELGPSIKKPRLRGLYRLLISDDRPVDGPLTEAYVNPVKEYMFIKVTGSGFGGPSTIGPSWYGPLPIKHPAKI